MDQLELHQQRKINTELHVGDQTVQFEHQLLDPENIQQEVTASRQSLLQFSAARAQLLHEAAPVVQLPVQAQPQAQAPQPAPAELSYKERKEKEKQRKAAVKAGKQYSVHADEQTIQIIQKQQEAAPNSDGPDGFRADYTPAELEREVQRVCDIRITADMFTKENFAQNSAMLREAVYKFQHIEDLAGRYPEYFARLPAADMLKHRALMRCIDMARPLEDMFRMASAASGLTLEGDGIREKNIVLHAREQMEAQLAQFRQTAERMEQRRQADIDEVFQAEFAAAEEAYQTVTKPEFQQLYMQENPDQAWMQVPSFNYFTYYEETQAMKELIEAKGETYLANREVIDRMYSDMIHQLEVYGELKAKGSAMTDLQDKYSPHLQQRGTDRSALASRSIQYIDRMAGESRDVIDRFEAIKAAAKALLKGARLNPLDAAVLESYGYGGAAALAAQAKADATACARRSAWQLAALQKLLDRGDFQTDHPESEYVQRAVTLFREGDDAYNLQVLHTMQRHEKATKRKPPEQTPGMSPARYHEIMEDYRAQCWVAYDDTRQLMLPIVERTMAWDVEAALRMSDAELIAHQAELDALFGDNMFASDLMKLQHPECETIQMKDEILGDRLDDFSYRVSMLRGLAEKSRALAIKFAAKLGPLTGEYFTGRELRTKVHDPAAEGAAFADARIAMANRLIESTRARRADERDVNSPAFKRKCEELRAKKPIFGAIPWRGCPVDEINDRYETLFGLPQAELEKQPLEDRAVVQRLHAEQYHLTCWDGEDARAYLRAKGLDPTTMRPRDIPDTIGEPIFRSFTTHFATAGAQTISREEYQQMLRDLSAGYGMEKGVTPEAEIQAAREQNMRGCRQFKESLRVQYDYVGRKYGFALETMSLLDIYDHYEEILTDFANVQVDLNFITKVPNIVDEENPEDVLLSHKIQYMSMMSYLVQNAITMFVQVGMSPEEIQQNADRSITLPTVKPHRDVLLAAGADAGMTQQLRWRETVGARRRPIE